MSNKLETIENYFKSYKASSLLYMNLVLLKVS